MSSDELIRIYDKDLKYLRMKRDAAKKEYKTARSDITRIKRFRTELIEARNKPDDRPAV